MTTAQMKEELAPILAECDLKEGFEAVVAYAEKQMGRLTTVDEYRLLLLAWTVGGECALKARG